MFQDEARFGRMVRIRRCWAPVPFRPMVDNGYERQFTYVYGAVSPMQGELDWMISLKMNTEQILFVNLIWPTCDAFIWPTLDPKWDPDEAVRDLRLARPERSPAPREARRWGEAETGPIARTTRRPS